MPMMVKIGGGLKLGTGYYWEMVPTVLAGAGGTDTMIGFVAALPSDGASIVSQTVTSGGYSASYRSAGDCYFAGAVRIDDNTDTPAVVANDVVGCYLRGGFFWVAINGVMTNNGYPIIGGIRGTVYPACSVVANTSDSVTARFASSSWSYTPPSGFVGIGDSAVFADENSVTLSGGNLIMTSGTVNSFTPCRTTTGIASMASGFADALLLPDAA